MDDEEPPYHLVQDPRFGGKHIGPFTTHLDAALALRVADYYWNLHATIMDKKQFDAHLNA
jgi:hypothetical protein